MGKYLMISFFLVCASITINAKNPADSIAAKRSVGKGSANIYPNPTNGDIKIQNLPFDKGSVEVCTLQGKVVKNVQIEKSSDYTISLQDLLSQPYIIKIKSSDGAATSLSSKVVVKQ